MIFKEIPGLPNHRASSDGTIWSKWASKPHRLRPKLDRGYEIVTICHEGAQRTESVHRLVCSAFHGPCPGKYPQWHACHKNGNRRDNRPENLRWATAKENMADQYRHGTRIRGETNHAAKLTAADVVTIRSIKRNTKMLARKFGVSKTTIKQVRCRDTWAHV